jgi:2-haloacid dehalogenase
MAAEPIVVFDVGNVLIAWDPKHLFRKIFADEARMDWFLTHVCTMDWNLEQDRGRSWAEGVAELTAQHPDWAGEIAAYDRRWSEMVAGAIAPSVAVLDALKDSGRSVYAITNFSAEKWQDSQARFPFLTRFDGVIVSAHEKLLKPDPAIYRRLFERYGLEPAGCLFIDDSQRNITTAASLGMLTVPFTPDTDLRAALAALGVQL